MHQPAREVARRVRTLSATPSTHHPSNLVVLAIATTAVLVLGGCSQTAEDNARDSADEQRSQFETQLVTGLNDADGTAQFVADVKHGDVFMSTRTVLLLTPGSLSELEVATFNYPTTAVFSIDATTDTTAEIDVVFSGAGSEKQLIGSGQNVSTYACLSYRIDIEKEDQFSSTNGECPSFLDTLPASKIEL